MIGSNSTNGEFPLECPLAKLGRSSPPYQHSSSSTSQSMVEQSFQSLSINSDAFNDVMYTHGTAYNSRPHESSECTQNKYNIDQHRSLETILRNASATFERYHTSSNQSSHRRFRQPLQHRTTSPSEASQYGYSGTTPCNYIVDQIDKLGRSSPSFDQGYHTLVSPSPGPSTPRPWIECAGKNMFKGKARTSNLRNNCFSMLPDSVTLKIFSWLSSSELCVCAQVCRRFEHLVWTPSLWKTITLKGTNVSGDKAIKNVLQKLCGHDSNMLCSTIERVFISEGARLTDKGLILLARRAPELTHLQVQGCSALSNIALLELVSRCHNLQHLDVTGCIRVSTLATPTVSSRKLMLQYLDLTDCSSIDDNGLRTIVVNCPQLVYLYLRRCVQITDAGIKCVPSFCSALRELSVSDCTNLTDFGLYELAKLGSTLRYLSVAKCDRVSDPGLKVIVRRCYKLRYLNARGCEAVSDDAITVLARSCPRLRALDIGKCDVTDNGLRELAESCPNLKKLSLRNCELITDKGVQCIAYYCRGLQLLNIQDCQITIEGYRAVKKFCKRCVIEHTNPGFF